MIGLIAGLVSALAAFGMLTVLAVTGFRNGDLPADARVTAVLAEARQADERRPVIAATVRNASDVPVLVGLSVRTSFFAGGMTARVPWRTAGRRYRADTHDALGVVPAGEAASFRVPIRRHGRHYQMVAVVGQDGRRLRVLTVPVAATPSVVPGIPDIRRVP
jgi:hypothetical protein